MNKTTDIVLTIDAIPLVTEKSILIKTYGHGDGFFLPKKLFEVVGLAGIYLNEHVTYLAVRLRVQSWFLLKKNIQFRMCSTHKLVVLDSYFEKHFNPAKLRTVEQIKHEPIKSPINESVTEFFKLTDPII